MTDEQKTLLHRNSVETDDEDNEVSGNEVSDLTGDPALVKPTKLTTGRIVLLRRLEKRDLIEEGKKKQKETTLHCDSVSKKQAHQQQLNVATSSQTGSLEKTSSLQTTQQNEQNENEVVNQNNNTGSALTNNGATYNNSLSLEQRALMYEEARRRIFGVGSSDSTASETLPLVSQRAPPSLRSFRPRPVPLVLPSCSLTTAYHPYHQSISRPVYSTFDTTTSPYLLTPPTVVYNHNPLMLQTTAYQQPPLVQPRLVQGEPVNDYVSTHIPPPPAFQMIPPSSSFHDAFNSSFNLVLSNNQNQYQVSPTTNYCVQQRAPPPVFRPPSTTTTHWNLCPQDVHDQNNLSFTYPSKLLPSQHSLQINRSDDHNVQNHNGVQSDNIDPLVKNTRDISMINQNYNNNTCHSNKDTSHNPMQLSSYDINFPPLGT